MTRSTQAGLCSFPSIHTSSPRARTRDRCSAVAWKALYTYPLSFGNPELNLSDVMGDGGVGAHFLRGESSSFTQSTKPNS